MVTIEARAVSKGAEGGQVITWATFATLWAHKVPQGSREYYAAGQTSAEQIAIYKTDYIDGVKATMRLIDGADVYDIFGCPEIGRREGLEIRARLLAAP